ncbi:hypothetical protein DXG01_013564 [Tephrocybe rancida]|nr:hypothetical protein DXG01_013564 [Tephrocybe rancida]
MFSSLLMIVSALPLLVLSCQDFMVSPNEYHTIHPNGDKTKCLDVRGASFQDGTAVQIFDCNGTPAQQWKISYGTTTVKIEAAPFCLDAGNNPGNGVLMKIWQCFPGLPAQTWYYTPDNRIALKDKGLCLDLPGGVHFAGNQVQTWKCTDGNTNQVWTLD